MMDDPAFHPLPAATNPGEHWTSGTAHSDIFFVPAPERVVAEMLKIAQINSRDLVMDLGSGEGQILITAARQHGARGIGIESDPRLVEKSRALAQEAGVADRVEFIEQDFFQADLRPATALMLYLLDSINIRLRPRILAECRPGTRVVTYSFEMGGWQCDAHTPIAANGVSLWIVPANLTGTWLSSSGAGPVESLALAQHFQELAGSAVIEGHTWRVAAGRVRGSEFTLALEDAGGRFAITGRIDRGQLHATVRSPGGEEASWQAARESGTETPLENQSS